MKTQEVHAAPQTIGAMTKTGSGVPTAVSFASVLSSIREEARARAAGILRDAAPCAREEATTKLRGDLSTETVRRLLPDGTLRITEYQDGKVKSVFFTVLNFHMKAWDDIQQAKTQFEQAEQERVEKERMQEELRIAQARAEALYSATAAAAAFGLFMLLALYLLGAKIETNLRGIDRSLADMAQQRRQP